jgi:hypothetical protein
MAGSDLTKNDLKEAFAEALKQHSRSSSGFGGPTSSSGGKDPMFDQVMSGLTDQFKGLAKFGIGVTTDSFTQLSKGGMRVSDALNILGDNARGSGVLFGETFGKFSQLLAKGAGFYEDNLDAFRLLSKTGASFGNSLVAVGEAAAGTRLGIREFTSLIETNNKAFATLPGGVAAGSKMFAQASQELFDKSGLIDEMTGLGYTTEDLNSLLSATIVQQRRMGLNDADARQVAIEQVKSLGKEMDLMAKLTGTSRKEQEDILRKQQEDGQVQAALADEMARGGKNVQEGFNAMTLAAQQAGPDFQKLSEQIFAMGRPTEDMIGKFNAIGPAAQKALYESAEAAKRGDEVRARELAERAAALATIQQQSNTNRQLARQGEKDFMDMQTQTRGFSTQLMDIAAANKLNLQTEEGITKALEIRRQQVEKEQAASDGATKALIAIENATKDASAGIRQGIVNQVNSSSPIGMALKEFYSNLDAAKGKDNKSNLDDAKGKDNKIREASAEATNAAFSKLIGTIADTAPSLKNKMKAVEEGLTLSKEQGTGLTGKSPELIGFITMLDKNSKLNEMILTEAKERKISQEQVIKEMVAKGPEALDKIVKESLKAKEAELQKEKERSKLSIPEQRALENKERRQRQQEGGGGILDSIQSITGVGTMSVDRLDILKGVSGFGTREGGTVEKTGKLTEPSDLLAFIHQGERVLNPKETEAFNNLGNKLSNIALPISDKFSSSMSSMMPKMQQALASQSTSTVQSTADQMFAGGSNLSLNDVVDRLERLNSTMTAMIDVQVDIGNKQITATKSSGSSNVYERA